MRTRSRQRTARPTVVGLYKTLYALVLAMLRPYFLRGRPSTIESLYILKETGVYYVVERADKSFVVEV